MKWWLLGKPAASLGGTSVSSPIYAPLLAKDLLCGLCHIALSAVTQQCAAKPVPDWSQWSADSRVVWGQPVLIPGMDLTQVQGLAIEFYEIRKALLLKPIKIPLDNIPSLK
ncbi:hypothetical protein HGM15179_004675 [Zosterops borbonicus]|uniref:Uncharacterized protein n=1 Tax=Zosterops borbonicus TaxID=364589 RepID=A0A8K1GQG1_9PASS|nr:hypothetical protein HGM15179_004675 [Zosterops borbonicus]